MKTLFQKFTLTIAGVLLIAPLASGATSPEARALGSLEKEVRHELVMLAWLGVFDNLQFQVNGDTVVLSGQVTRPTLQKDAERVVRRIEGVTNVVNNIEVLPLSPFDNRIRLAAYRQIYGFGALSRYSLGTLPSIRIIVKNGHITLHGVVANEGDRNIAGIRANGVSGAFSVTNGLRVENRT
jgi:hyperosmotically inducible periplasmic protein